MRLYLRVLPQEQPLQGRGSAHNTSSINGVFETGNTSSPFQMLRRLRCAAECIWLMQRLRKRSPCMSPDASDPLRMALGGCLGGCPRLSSCSSSPSSRREDSLSKLERLQRRLPPWSASKRDPRGTSKFTAMLRLPNRCGAISGRQLAGEVLKRRLGSC